MSLQARRERIRVALLITVVAGLALGSFWILTLLRQGSESALPIAKDEIDFTVEKFNFVRMSKSGEARYNISGQSLRHFPHNDSFEVDQPLLHNLAPGQAPMNMKAMRAVIEQGNKRIHLYDKVEVDRPASEQNPVFKLRTDYLQVLPDEDRMQTNQLVHIQSGRAKITASGMDANNATRQIFLSNKVSGSFLPPP